MNTHRSVLVIDVESTGFDPSRNACIELGAVMLNQGLERIHEFSSLIAPWPGAEILPAAMSLHGIAANELRSAPPVDVVLANFEQVFGLELTSPVPLLAGWNVWFDAAFLRSMYERGKREWPFGHRVIDVQSVVSFHSLFANLSQQSVIETLLGEQQTHRALDDARHTARLLQILGQRYLTPSSELRVAVSA